MTDPARDSRANKRLAKLLQEKCREWRLRVNRIRPSAPNQSSVEVEVQLDLNDYSFQRFNPVTVNLNPSLNVGQGRSCLDDQIIDAIGKEFPCDRLRLEE